jgi:hypothetical protein
MRFHQAIEPTRLIFTGIGILLSVSYLDLINTIILWEKLSRTNVTVVIIQAATTVSNRRDKLIIIFERIENVFRRLENYIEYPRTFGMIHAIVKVMAEVLCILGIATKEFRENRASELILAKHVPSA